MINPYPADNVLIARGKYATLSSERRTLLNKLRDDMEAVADRARRVVRHIEDDFASSQESAEQGAALLSDAMTRLEKIAALTAELAALKPAAWGKSSKESE